jgi:DNA-directed RNA polymerase subunit RPC12/RpoP
MLTIKCAKCKSKLFKYKKIGKGKVLRCWKSKITRIYDAEVINKKLVCSKCKNEIGEIKDKKIDMNLEQFTYTGTKISK